MTIPHDLPPSADGLTVFATLRPLSTQAAPPFEQGGFGYTMTEAALFLIPATQTTGHHQAIAGKMRDGET